MKCCGHQKRKRDFKDFEKRLPAQFKRYNVWKANYSKAYFDIKATVTPTPAHAGVQLKLESNSRNAQFYMKRHDANTPWVIKSTGGTKYTKPIIVNTSGAITSWSVEDGKSVLSSVTQKFWFNKATGKVLELKTPPLEAYPGNGGAFGLVNGLISEKGITSPEWLGWRGNDMELTVDLGKPQSITNIGIHTLNRGGSRVYTPAELQVYGSKDGQSFSSLGTTSEFVQDASETSGTMNVQCKPVETRYVKIIAKNYAKIPEGKTGAGDPALMLIDEIMVE